MVLTNWLAKGDGSSGLVLPSEFKSKNVRIYGYVYGNPNFADGEYVQTALVNGYDGNKITTTGDEEYTLLEQAPVYEWFMQAMEKNILIIKNWKVKDGLLLGNTLEGIPVSGRIVTQGFRNNICTFKDGRQIFVDWLSKDPEFIPKKGPEEFMVFGIEKCMPDIFGKHFYMFRRL